MCTQSAFQTLCAGSLLVNQARDPKKTLRTRKGLIRQTLKGFIRQTLKGLIRQALKGLVRQAGPQPGLFLAVTV